MINAELKAALADEYDPEQERGQQREGANVPVGNIWFRHHPWLILAKRASETVPNCTAARF